MHQSMPCIDQSRPLADEPLTHPVQRLEILLVDVLDGNTAHGRPRHGFSDSRGVAPIVCMRLHGGLDTRGRHACDLVPLVAPVTGGSGAMKGIRAWRVSCVRHPIVPVVSVPTRWKIFFARSMPTVVTWGFMGLVS
jgi:hypothetical protein